MLSPESRQLYVEALDPPDGYVLHEALGTTYSVDLLALLSVPVRMALGRLDPKRITADECGPGVLSSIRQTAPRFTVFHDEAHLAVPSTPNLLFGMLEGVVLPTRAPNKGAFHPKVWLLHFKELDGTGEAVRLVILSRNLTFDRSWDVSLVLEGTPRGMRPTSQRALETLFSKLPEWATVEVPDDVKLRCARMADLARRTAFDLPPDWESVSFHLLGIDARPFSFEPCDRLMVVSPFVSTRGLEQAAAGAARAVALVSRAEELDAAPADASAAFENVWVLADAAASEDGEDASLTPPALRGLHAKIFAAETGATMRLYVGSANATHAALTGMQNVEVLAELVGKRSRVGGIESFLDAKKGFGRLLERYQRPSTHVEKDAELERAEARLEELQRAIAEVRVRISFARTGDEVTPTLSLERPIGAVESVRAKVWLVTVSEAQATSIELDALASGAALPTCAVAAATTFVAFALGVEGTEASRRFVLPALCDDLPADRDAHVVRLVVSNRERFLAYLMALLSSHGDEALLALLGAPGAQPTLGGFALATPGLLEQLVRARSRDPGKLREVRALVRDLEGTEDGRDVLPPEFRSVWSVLDAEDSP